MRRKVFILIIVFLGLFFFKHETTRAAVTTPLYTVDYKSQVIFGSSVQVGPYLGLENYVADYVDGYLHITYTITHQNGIYSSYPPFLYVRKEDPTISSTTTYLYQGLANRIVNSSSNPTDYYFVDIQFSATGYREVVTRGVNRTAVSDNAVSISWLNADTFIALANSMPMSNPPTASSMSFQPMRLVPVAPSKIFSFAVATTTQTATVHSYISVEDVGVEMNFNIASSSSGQVYSTSSVVATTTGDFYYTWNFPQITDSKTTQSTKFTFYTDIKKSTTTLRVATTSAWLWSPTEGYPGHRNTLNNTSESLTYVAQTLGSNFSGVLTQIDVVTSNRSALYYGSRPMINLLECDNDTYGGLSLLGAVNPSSGCVTLYSEISNDSSGASTSTQHFYTPSIEFNPAKYYFIRMSGNNPINVLPAYHGSGEDVVDGGCFRLNYTNGQAIPCSNISDLSFYLRGVTKMVPEPPCTENCNSNVMFLPGVMGSRLYENIGGEKERWMSLFESDQERLKMNPDGTSRNLIYTKEGDGGLVDSYGGDVYGSFINTLKQWKTDGVYNDYALVPYDWRLSLNQIITSGTTTAEGLSYLASQGVENSYIYKQAQRLIANSRTGKITLVGHSNGGLVIKAFMAKLKELNDPLYEKIDNVILVATPQVGTPDAVAALLHGTEVGPGGFVIDAQMMRSLSQNMPTTYHLLPSSAYFNGDGVSVSTPVILFNPGLATDQYHFTHGSNIVSPIVLNHFLLGSEGREAPSINDLNDPAIASASLLLYAQDIHSVIDNWTPASTTKVYQLAGWGIETVSGIEYTTQSKCVRVGVNLNYQNCIEWKPFIGVDVKHVVDGDKTVVAPSALAMSTSTSNVERWWFDLEKYNTDNDDSRTHASVMGVPGIQSFILNTIKPNTTTTSSYITSYQPSYVGLKPRLHFTLHSPLDLIARDTQGNETSSSTNTIPGALYRQYGDVQWISVPQESNPTVNLVGTGSGSFNLDVAEVQGNTVLATTTFAQIPNSTSTTASISFSGGTIQEASPLSIDFNGDGGEDVSLVARLDNTAVMYIEPATLNPTPTRPSTGIRHTLPLSPKVALTINLKGLVEFTDVQILENKTPLVEFKTTTGWNVGFYLVGNQIIISLSK